MRGTNGWGFCLENKTAAVYAVNALSTWECMPLMPFMLKANCRKISRKTKQQPSLSFVCVPQKLVKSLCVVPVQVCLFASKRNYVSTWPNNANQKTDTFCCCTFFSVSMFLAGDGRSSDSMNSLHYCKEECKHCSHDTKSYKSIYYLLFLLLLWLSCWIFATHNLFSTWSGCVCT